MRVMIVDDERLCLDDMVFMLSRYDQVDIIGTFTKPLEALHAIREAHPDVVFLDLSMPGMHGGELAGFILEQNSSIQIVFVTAFVKELAGVAHIPSFGSLLKPVDEVGLHVLMERLRKRIEDQAGGQTPV